MEKEEDEDEGDMVEIRRREEEGEWLLKKQYIVPSVTFYLLLTTV